MARRITNGDEQEVHSKWRKFLCCMHRAGVATKTKKRTNRRERREGQAEALEQYYEREDECGVTRYVSPESR